MPQLHVKMFCDWDRFNDSPRVKEDLEGHFESLKLRYMSTFGDRMYRLTLIKELYSSIAIDKIELKEEKEFEEDRLNVFLNGEDFQISAQDLGEFLKIEFEVGAYKILEKYEPNHMWEVITGKREKFPQEAIPVR